MNNNDQYGFFLFQKDSSSSSVLKDMLQYLRSHAPGKKLQFAYVEGETSLIPHLSLWENLHVVVGGSNWKEFTGHLEPDWQPLINLISNPHIKASAATCWERLTISLLKATLINSQHILVDLDENLHSPLNLLNFKKILSTVAAQQNVYIATANTSLWLDSCHSIIKREGYVFKVDNLDQIRIKRHRSA